jgi:hypothetical protein
VEEGRTENYVISDYKPAKKLMISSRAYLSKYALADDVVQFIKDNAGAAE